MKKNDISVVIVNHNLEKELLRCIKSLISSKPKFNFEIIVIDNSDNSILRKKLSSFSDIKYVSQENKGFGAGLNKGVRVATGKFIYILNPNTIIFNNALEKQYQFIKSKQAGLVSASIVDKNRNVYKLQGASHLDFLSGLIAISFLNKFFPNNPVSRKFWLKNIDRNKIQEVDVTPLVATLVKKEILEKIGMFDENLFLYFEEFDISRRINALGFKNYILPNSKVYHSWGKSTKERKDIEKIYAKSEFYYFRKHFGLMQALGVYVFNNIPKWVKIFSRL